MKNILFLFLCIGFLTTSCKDDDEVATNESTLNYDAANFSAPALPIDNYEAAARFTSSETSNLTGQFLKEVEVYFVSVPATTEIIIYGEGNNNSPGDILYTANIGSSLSTDSWNRHVLSTPIEITTEDIWIAVKMNLPAEVGFIGCDPGPANSNGDFLFVNSDNSWTNLRSFTNQETDINWNIRGVVGE